MEEGVVNLNEYLWEGSMEFNDLLFIMSTNGFYIPEVIILTVLLSEYIYFTF